MKLEKVTQASKTAKNRWYDDACGTAFALELVGERWSLLIVRELMFGPRRFGELRASLPGISANILTQRLEGLVAEGVAARRKLPSPASVQVYELTPWGYEAEEVIKVMGRWATRSPGHDPTLPLSAASLMLSFRTMLSAERAKGIDAKIGFRLGAESFVAKLDAESIAIRRGEPDGADVTFDSTPHAMAAVVYGGRPLADAQADGSVRIEGDRALAERFVTLFPLPEKIA
ncbi:MAG: transcriptional regulator [Sphingomonadaceae bacterium]|nr:transcriptional regulator [Sphingomonadaceae bacterium]